MKLDHPIAVWCRNYEWKGHHEFIRDFTIRLAPYEPDQYFFQVAQCFI